jgi:hypothetical protein
MVSVYGAMTKERKARIWHLWQHSDHQPACWQKRRGDRLNPSVYLTGVYADRQRR